MLKQKIQVLVLCCLILVCTVFTVHAEAAGRLLPLDREKLQAVGKQDSRGEACSCYALAYCRTILDGIVHSFSEYNQNGNTEFNVLCVWSKGGYASVTAENRQQVLQACYDSINAGRPLILHVKTKYSQHWVTVVGYRNVENVKEMTEENLLIIDPLSRYDGEILVNPYSLYDYRYIKTDKGSAVVSDTQTAVPSVNTPSADAPSADLPTGNVQEAEQKQLTGDVDENGTVNAVDALMILRHAAQIGQLPAQALETSDVNGDGVVDAKDALEILQHCAKLTDAFSKNLHAVVSDEISLSYE